MATPAEPASLTVRTRVLTTLLLVGIALDAVTYVLVGHQIGVLDRLENLDALFDDRQLLRSTAWARLGVLVLTAWTWLAWLRRAYGNLSTSDRSGRSPGWALGSWFVPIASLVWPWQIVRETWRRSGGRGMAVVNAWWLAWLTAGLTYRVAIRSRRTEGPVDELLRGAFWDQLGNVALILASTMLLLIIRQVAAEGRGSEPAKLASQS